MVRKAPKYALHKPSGQARVRIKGKDFYLGEHGSQESRDEYDRLIAKFYSRKLDVTKDSVVISRLAVNYIEFARGYYRKNGSLTSEFHVIQMALRPLIALFGCEKAHLFGAKKLKQVRESMIESGLARTSINQAIQRINRMFRWATENEYVDVTVYQACKAVTGLRRGRCEAVEPEPVAPVPAAHIESVQPHVHLTVWNMIQMQLCTGMRPGEVRIMRPCDIKMLGDVWEYRPERHKTEHHGRARVVFIGPRGQEILKPFLEDSEPAEYLFRPVQPASSRKEAPQRTPGLCYRRDSYTRAIRRACEIAEIPAWSPNQLRHNAATLLREKHGLEATRTVLGHSTADMTEVYAEIDLESARKIMLASG